MKKFKWLASAALAAALVAGCGGGGSEKTANSLGLTSLVSFGDSLSDVGTHKVGTVLGLANATGGGGRWTINSTTGGELWVERLSAALALPVPCAAETGLLPNNGATGAPRTPNTLCRNYAQGSSRVTNPLGPVSVAAQTALGEQNIGILATPMSLQFAAHLKAVGGLYSGKELVTVLAGANDVFLEAQFVQLALQTPQTAIANAAVAGTTLGNLVKTEVVAKGAKQVLVLTIPDVAGTPLGVNGGPASQGLLDALTRAFNDALQAALRGTTGVIVADSYASNKDQLANPAAYGLSNVRDVACGPNAFSNPAGSNGSSLVCNASNTRAGIDVSKYLYADDVHPTPFGHQLLAQFVGKILATAGWL